MMETFIDIVNLTKKRVKFTAANDVIDTVIKEAINHCYMNELAKEDKRIKITYLIPVNGSAALPNDLVGIERIEPELTTSDRLQGNLLFTDKTDQLTLHYSYVREPLTEDADEPDINTKYFYPMSTYGCYAYFAYKKKADMANMYLNQFRREVQQLKKEINVPQKIQNVYGW
jgi:hypothetical protein